MSTKKDYDTVLRQVTVGIPDDLDNEGDPPLDTNDDTEKRDKMTKTFSNQHQVEYRTKMIKKAACLCFLIIAFLLGVASCVASFTIPSLENATLRGLAVWKWCLLVTALLSGPLLSTVIGPLVNFLFVDRKYLIMPETAMFYFVGLAESAWVVLWFSMILLAWLWVVLQPKYLRMPYQNNDELRRKFAATEPFITVTIINLILGSLLWLIKQLALMKAESSFRLKRFYDRIIKALMHQYVIETLSGTTIDNEGNEKYVLIKKYDYEDHTHAITYIRHTARERVDLSTFDDKTQEEVSFMAMKRLIKGIIQRPYLTYDHKNLKIDNEAKAVLAADVIFARVVEGAQESSLYIQEDDLRKYFKHDKKVAQVKECLLEGADAKKIGRDVFKKWMVKAFRHRETLVRTLDANRSMFQAFSRFVDVLLILLIVALWLIMLKDKTRKIIFVFGTALVGAAVILGDTSRKLVDNLLFLFLVHPFDIDDWCLIDGTPVIIKEIHILCTVALAHGHELRHYSNLQLASQTIVNYTRSSELVADNVEFYFNIDTPIEKIEILQDHIRSYIKKNSNYWHKDLNCLMELVQLDGTSKIKLTLELKHTVKYYEFAARQARKTLLVKEIKKAMDKLLLDAKKEK